MHPLCARLLSCFSNQLFGSIVFTNIYVYSKYSHYETFYISVSFKHPHPLNNVCSVIMLSANVANVNFHFVFKLNLVLINRPAGNSGLAKAAIKFCAKIKHPLGSLRQAENRYITPNINVLKSHTTIYHPEPKCSVET